MELKKYLVATYGFSEEKVEEILKQSRMKNETLVKQKLDEVFQLLDLDIAEQKNIIAKWPQTLNVSSKNIKEKAEFYEKEYGISLAQFKNMAKLNFAPVHCSKAKVKQLEEYFYKNWGMSKSQFVGKMRHAPGVVGLAPSSIDEKTEALGKMYDMDYAQLEKLIKSGSNYPLISMEKIDDMAAFFKKEFGVSDKNFGKMLVSGKPISYTKEKIMEEYLTLKKNVGLTPMQFGVMMSRCPTMLGVAPETLQKRVDKLQELGFDLDTIVDSSRTLVINENKMKARYVMAKVNEMSDKKFLSTGFMHDDRKIFSRMMYLTSHGISNKYLYQTEKKFEKYVGVSTDDILLTNVDMKKVEETMLDKYNKMYGDTMQFAPEEMGND